MFFEPVYTMNTTLCTSKHLDSYPLTNPFGKEQCVPIQLSNQIGMYIVSTIFDDDKKVNWSVHQSTIVFGFCVTGESSFQHAQNNQPILFSQHNNVWFINSRSTWYQEIKGGQVFKAIYLYMDLVAFQHLMGNSMTKLCKDLYQALMGAGLAFMEQHKLSASAQAVKICEAILDCPYTGPSQPLYWKAKGLELLANLLQRLTACKVPPVAHSVLSKRENRLIAECHQLLIERFMNPPTVYELSVSLNLSIIKLNRGFKQTYGLTINKFLAEQRLLWARQLLQTGAHSVSDVARTVGFKHAGSFSNSFYVRFGNRPGEYIQLKSTME